MRRTWVAILTSSLALLFALGMLYFSTVGAAYLGTLFRETAGNVGGRAGIRLYGIALKIDPYDSESRLALADLYRANGQSAQAEALLREGTVSYAKGPELFLALAELYTGEGRLVDACALLDGAPSGYISRRLNNLRPLSPNAPASGSVPYGTEIRLQAESGICFYSMDGLAWQKYHEPLALSPGRHTLKALSLDESGVPSEIASYSYEAETDRKTAFVRHTFRCPHCGEAFHVYLSH